MTPEQLVAYIKECALKRQSAAARRTSLHKEAGTMGVKKESKKKKDSVSLAMDLLNQLSGPGHS
jgi:hypothetical protein